MDGYEMAAPRVEVHRNAPVILTVRLNHADARTLAQAQA